MNSRLLTKNYWDKKYNGEFIRAFFEMAGMQDSEDFDQRKFEIVDNDLCLTVRITANDFHHKLPELYQRKDACIVKFDTIINKNSRDSYFDCHIYLNPDQANKTIPVLPPAPPSAELLKIKESYLRQESPNNHWLWSQPSPDSKDYKRYNPELPLVTPKTKWK